MKGQCLQLFRVIFTPSGITEQEYLFNFCYLNLNAKFSALAMYFIFLLIAVQSFLYVVLAEEVENTGLVTQVGIQAYIETWLYVWHSTCEETD